jgi:hypothetical protein
MNFKFDVYSVSHLLTAQFPASDSMLGGNLLDRSGGMLISVPQKIGKSLFASQLVLTLEDRKPFLGFPPSGAEYRTLVLKRKSAPSECRSGSENKSRVSGHQRQPTC